MLNQHGGNLTHICSTYGLNPNDVIDFSANINPLGYPAGLDEAVLSNLNTILHYPDPDSSGLRKLLAADCAVNENNIVIGNGSTELFYLIPRVIKAANGYVFQPTFTEFPRALACSGTNVVNVICDQSDKFRINPARALEYGLDKEHSFSGNGRMFSNIVFLCNPNNPTGRLVEKDEILSLAEKLPGTLVVVDEAFMDFVPDSERYSVMAAASKMKNLIVVQSLTKFYGIPGIRLGYLVAHEDTTKALNKNKEPWSVNTLAQFAGTVLTKDKEFAAESRKFTNSEKDFLFKEMSEINDIEVFEPSVNFILARIKDGDLTASTLYDRLLKHGIVIRNCSNFTGLSEQYFRVAVRTRKENVKLIEALRKELN